MFTRLISFIRRKISQKYRFNQQFAEKKWDGMRALADLGRYSIIAGYVKYFCKTSRILDLGCGEGILAEKFGSGDFDSYLGVDFSDVAINNAQRIANGKVHFEIGDLNKLTLTGTYDAIIYNETIYYMTNPKAAVKALFKNLSPDGVFIISMVDKHGKERTGLWDDLADVLQPIEKTKVTNSSGDSWTIQVYRPRI